MTYFSHLEFELINEKDRSSSGASTNSASKQSNSTNSLNLLMNSVDLISSPNSIPNLNGLSYYSCVIDRNRMIKSVNENQPQSSLVRPMSLTPDVTSSMNVFYEIIKSMPELSKLQIR